MEDVLETPFDLHMKKLAEKAREDLAFSCAWRRGRAATLLAEAKALEEGGWEEGKSVYDKDGKRVE